MRVRILCLVVLGLMVAPLGSWAAGPELDPYGGSSEQTSITIETDPIPSGHLTARPARSSAVATHPSEADHHPSMGDSSGSFFGTLFHWLSSLMPSV